MTKFRGLEPTNPQGKTSKQLIQKKFRGKNPTNNCIATKITIVTTKMLTSYTCKPKYTNFVITTI